EFLAEFDYVLEYRLGCTNLVADALSRKVGPDDSVAVVSAIVRVESDLLEQIKVKSEIDLVVCKLLAQAGMTRHIGIGRRMESSMLLEGDLTSQAVAV
ncbi:hypothetical protein ACLOJK_029653, partial [Asimina triloba]